MRNLGFVGYENYCVTRDGSIYSIRSSRFLKVQKGKNGYKTILLSQDKVQKRFYIHRLIALAYIENPGGKQCVNHVDGDKHNNSISNLEWATHTENSVHAIETGLHKQPRKLNDEIAHKVCQSIVDGMRNKDIAEMFGISKESISAIKRGSIYMDISKEYDFSYVPPSKSRVNPDKLRRLCEMIESGNYTYTEMCRILNTTTWMITNVKKRRVGTYISKNYNW